NLKNWIGAGVSGGTGGTDFNAAANWSPSGTPTAADSCVMTVTSAATVTLSADATIGALRSRESGANNVFRLDINNKTLTLFRTIDGDVTSGNGATHVEYQVGSGVGSVGTLDIGGDANLAPTSAGMTV